MKLKTFRSFISGFILGCVLYIAGIELFSASWWIIVIFTVIIVELNVSIEEYNI